jgi:ankyrin repeat protein
MKQLIKRMGIFVFTFSSFLQSSEEKLLSDKDLSALISTIHEASSTITDLVKKEVSANGFSLTNTNVRYTIRLEEEECNKCFLHALSKGNPIWRNFLGMGANINAFNSYRENCLFLTRDIEVLKELIDLKASINWRNKDNKTPFIYQCEHYLDDIPRAKLFLSNGADPNAIQYVDGPSLLSQSIKKNRVDMVQLLCQYQVNVNQEVDDSTPLMIALTQDYSLFGDVKIINILLDAGANPNSFRRFEDKEGYRQHAIHYVTGWPALKTFNEPLALLLLKRGANPNIPYPFSNGRKYPIHEAVKINNMPLLKALLDAQASIDVKDEKGLTPLALAESSGSSACIIALLSNPTHTETQSEEIAASFLNDYTLIDNEEEVNEEKCSIQ